MAGIGDIFRRFTRRSRAPEPGPAETFEAAPDIAPPDPPDLAPPEPLAWEHEDDAPEPDLAPPPDDLRGPLVGEPLSSQPAFDDPPLRESVGSPPFESTTSVPADNRDDGMVGVLDAPLVEVPDDDALVDDPLVLVCPYCGAEGQRVGSRCGNERCNRVIVRLPPWAQHRRHNWFMRRLSWRRIATACVVALLIVFVIWVNYPFAPDPVVLFKKTQPS